MYKEDFMTDSNNADFLAAFGINPDDVQSNSGVNANPDAQTSEPDTNTVENEPDTQSQSQDVQLSQNNANDQIESTNDQVNQENTNPQPNVSSKANQAFAQMRSENSSLKRLIGDIASVLGIDANIPQDQMHAAVQNAVIQAQAKQQNVDPALLQEISQLKQFKQQAEQQSFTTKALIGFQTVKNQFNLTDTEIDAFADALMKDGVNPFTNEVNLVSEYKLRNFDKLIAAAEKRGAAQEATRQQNVAAHSTSPNKNTGKGADSEPEKITSMQELTNWFDGNNK